MRKVRLADYALGLQGVAVIRNWLRGDAMVAVQVRELREFAASLDRNPGIIEFELHEKDVASGHAAWSVTYDQAVNPLVSLEQPVVRSFIDAIPLGRALDAACGTGRHTEYLCMRSFDTTGVDFLTGFNDTQDALFLGGDFNKLYVSSLDGHLRVFQGETLWLVHDSRSSRIRTVYSMIPRPTSFTSATNLKMGSFRRIWFLIQPPAGKSHVHR
jgi:hypothetical protein